MSVTNNDITPQLHEQVQFAIDKQTPLCPRAGGSKDFLGRTVQAPTLDCSAHRGIINYEPMELVVTVRAGTPLHGGMRPPFGRATI